MVVIACGLTCLEASLPEAGHPMAIRHVLLVRHPVQGWEGWQGAPRCFEMPCIARLSEDTFR